MVDIITFYNAHAGKSSVLFHLHNATPKSIAQGKGFGPPSCYTTEQCLPSKQYVTITYLRGLYSDSSCCCLKDLFILTSKARHISRSPYSVYLQNSPCYQIMSIYIVGYHFRYCFFIKLRGGLKPCW